MKRDRFKPSKGSSFDETGAVFKRGKSLINAALVYPNTYEAGMSNLGFQTVYRLINDIETVYCQRVFLPAHKGKNTKPSSVETGLTLDAFDIILFSISFENDYIHLVSLLSEAGLPLRSSDRNHIHPLVVAGGVACFLNPEPISEFIDCFLLGEAELLIAPFFRELAIQKNRNQFLLTLESNVQGAYVPALHSPILWEHSPPDMASSDVLAVKTAPSKIKVQHVPDLSAIQTTTQILTRNTAFKNTYLIETGRGCPHGCRFCSAGFIYRPPRIYPETIITSAMDQAAKLTNKIGLVSSAVSNHPDIDSICKFGIERKLNISFSSLRADALTDDLITSIAGSVVKTATIAPEAGSQRMRDVINKKLDEPLILSCVRRLVTAGILNLRLYFMIGLPYETDEDAEAIVNLSLKIKHEFLESARKQKKIGTITLSINPFIPKPFTPFQWAPMLPEKTLGQRFAIIKNRLKKVPNVKLNFESLKQARINALLSNGDRKAADIIQTAATIGWSKAIKLNQAYCDSIWFSHHSPETVFPWDFLDAGVQKKFLLKEYTRAGLEKTSPACPMIDCLKCRICMN